MHADLARDAKVKKLHAWKRFEVFGPFKETVITKALVDTRRVLAWKLMDSKKSATARLPAKGCQDLDLEGGVVATPSGDIENGRFAASK